MFAAIQIFLHFLRIYRACLKITEESHSYPVIVFFHGGNFQTGSSNEWPGHVLASSGVVVVTVNYRLGAFGFMSLGDQNTGNYGLLVTFKFCAVGFFLFFH